MLDDERLKRALFLLALAVGFIIVMFRGCLAYGAYTVTTYGDTDDGYIYKTGVYPPEDWYGPIRAALTGDTQSVADATAPAVSIAFGSLQNRRAFYYFDLSALAGYPEPTTATVSLSSATKSGNVGAVLVAGAQGKPLTLTDYAAFADGTINDVVEMDRIASGSWSVAGYNPFNVSPAVAHSMFGGWGKFILLSTSDVDGTGAIEGTIYTSFAEDAGAKPKIVLFFDPPVSDLFDGSSVDPKWTTGDFFAAGGTVTESGGYLVLTPPGSVTSLPYAVQADVMTSLSCDLRAKVHLETALTDSYEVVFSIMQDYTDIGPNGPNNAVWAGYKNDAGVFSISRRDIVGGTSHDGTPVDVGDVRDAYFRIVGNGDGTFTAYYKLTACGAWIELAPNATELTGVTAPFDVMLWTVDALGTGAVTYWDWIVEDSENAGWPLCPSTNHIMMIW